MDVQPRLSFGEHLSEPDQKITSQQIADLRLLISGERHSQEPHNRASENASANVTGVKEGCITKGSAPEETHKLAYRTIMQRTLAADLRRLGKMLDDEKTSEARALARLLIPRVPLSLRGIPALQLCKKLEQIAGGPPQAQ